MAQEKLICNDVSLSKKSYYIQLDSLRGLAAISVILWHFWLCFDSTLSKIYKPYFFFLYGTGAVILFFVLSGFVLANSYANNEGYVDYIIRRVFRIYPAYYVALFISIFGVYYLSPSKIDWLSDVFNSWQNASLNVLPILNAFILINPKYVNLFVPPAWSLTIEMSVSVFFPILLFFSMRKSGNLFMVIYVFTIYLLKLKLDLYLPVLYYSMYFVIGIYIYKHQNSIFIKKISKLWLLPLYLCLYANPFISYRLNILHDIDLVTGIGAAGIIIVSLYSTSFIKFLKTNYLTFVGKLSYSIYLTHMPILFILVYIFKNILNKSNIFGIYILSFIVTILFSYLCYKYIERSFIFIGRKIYPIIRCRNN